MPFGLGFGELMIILVIVMIVFGANKLPQLGDGLGKSIRNFRRAIGAKDEDEKSPSEDKSKDAEDVSPGVKKP